MAGWTPQQLQAQGAAGNMGCSRALLSMLASGEDGRGTGCQCQLGSWLFSCMALHLALQSQLDSPRPLSCPLYPEIPVYHGSMAHLGTSPSPPGELATFICGGQLSRSCEAVESHSWTLFARAASGQVHLPWRLGACNRIVPCC